MAKKIKCAGCGKEFEKIGDDFELLCRSCEINSVRGMSPSEFHFFQEDRRRHLENRIKPFNSNVWDVQLKPWYMK